MKKRHCYEFEGADELVSIGASWFISYTYYLEVDETHKNWMLYSTRKARQATYRHSKEYHDVWLGEILDMSVAKLSQNELGLNGEQIKKMARKIIEKRYKKTRL